MWVGSLPTCAHFEFDGTVVQQVRFERLRDCLSEVVDFNVTWQQMSKQMRGQMNHYHLKIDRMPCKQIRGHTCFISDGDYRPSSDPHALRVDYRRAQKSCNGAIYCRTPLLEHAPGEEFVLTGKNREFVHTHIQLHTFWQPQAVVVLKQGQETSLNHVLILE